MRVQLMTFTEAAARLGVSRQAVWRWRCNPALNFPASVIICDRPYLDVADFEKWIESKKAKANKAA